APGGRGRPARGARRALPGGQVPVPGPDGGAHRARDERPRRDPRAPRLRGHGRDAQRRGRAGGGGPGRGDRGQRGGAPAAGVHGHARVSGVGPWGLRGPGGAEDAPLLRAGIAHPLRERADPRRQLTHDPGAPRGAAVRAGPMAVILVVDDEANIRRMLVRLLEAEGYRAREAADGAAALRVVEAEEPDVVLLDLAMPGMDGLETLAALRERWPALPVVMMSGRATLADAVRATKLGAFHFIEKPLTPEAVLITVKGGVELRRARELTRELAAELGAGDRLVGESEVMRQTRELIRRVAPTDARVLITGASGTGKELAAAMLHALSPRASGPFIRVNSAAIPRDLIESEMFGH